jgi:hypothetical protein
MSTYRSRLHELAQRRAYTLVYDTVASDTATLQSPAFTCTVKITKGTADVAVFTPPAPQGSKKKAAEEAAEVALRALEGEEGGQRTAPAPVVAATSSSSSSSSSGGGGGSSSRLVLDAIRKAVTTAAPGLFNNLRTGGVPLECLLLYQPVTSALNRVDSRHYHDPARGYRTLAAALAAPPSPLQVTTRSSSREEGGGSSSSITVVGDTTSPFADGASSMWRTNLAQRTRSEQYRAALTASTARVVVLPADGRAPYEVDLPVDDPAAYVAMGLEGAKLGAAFDAVTSFFRAHTGHPGAFSAPLYVPPQVMGGPPCPPARAPPSSLLMPPRQPSPCCPYRCRTWARPYCGSRGCSCPCMTRRRTIAALITTTVTVVVAAAAAAAVPR